MDNAENSSLPNFYISLAVKKHTLTLLSIFSFPETDEKPQFSFFVSAFIDYHLLVVEYLQCLKAGNNFSECF